MKVRQEFNFELTDKLRDRIFRVRRERDADTLMRKLGVPSGSSSGSLVRDFEYVAACIRSSEQRYGRAPIDFSADPFLGCFIAATSGFYRLPNDDRPVVGIKVIVEEYSPGWTRLHALPIRPEPTKVVIPAGTARIEPFCFRGCTRIKRVVIPPSVHELPAGAFWGCRMLDELVIPDGITSIGPATFAGCESLQRVVLPPSLEHIGCDAFRDCTQLEEVVAPAGFAVPRAMRIFDSCKLPAYSYCSQSHQPVDEKQALQELEDLLVGFAESFLDGPNSVHSFFVEEIGAPDADDTKEMPGEPVSHIHQMLDAAIDFAGSLYTDDYSGTTEEHLLILSQVIVDTLEGVAGIGPAPRAYECPPDIWDEYRKKCFIMCGAVVIQAGNKWYALVADWSD